MRFVYVDKRTEPIELNRMRGDCVVRALSIALDKPYSTVAIGLNRFIVKQRKSDDYSISLTAKASDVYTGVSPLVWQEYMKKRGWKIFYVYKRKIVRDFDNMDTTVLLSLNRHLTVMKNGVLMDRFNCANEPVKEYMIRGE
jgi:hypothetical protein